MSGFTLARLDDPRGAYVWITDNRTPADVWSNNAAAYVDAWAITTCGDDVAVLDGWFESADRAAAIAYITQWMEGATE